MTPPPLWQTDFPYRKRADAVMAFLTERDVDGEWVDEDHGLFRLDGSLTTLQIRCVGGAEPTIWEVVGSP